jgi:hypothetical protein
VPEFIDSCPSPIGFVAFDLDYYSSTRAALKLFCGPDSALLPRVFCYFDDTIGPDAALHCEFVGELLAIHEFNQEHVDRKLARINGLRHKRRIDAAWHDAMFVCHLFHHPLYNTYVNEAADYQLPLS